MILTIYSCTKQAEARAYHNKLSGFVSPILNNILLLAATASFIFGPCIGFFDCYYDMHMHMKVTQIFTIGEILYLVLITYTIATNRNQFEASASSAIDRCVLGILGVAGVGIAMNLGEDATGIAIG